MSDDPGEAATVREGQTRPREASTVTTERYKPMREIARGGMGRVVEAFDTKLSRTVALKEILDTHPDARGRFEREVEITARLEHPSIVPLYDSGTGEDGTPFYVMRKVTGSPLDQLIRNASTLDQRLRLLPNVLALADAVAHAHARGVIHRDLKPSNVLVGELGETVVIDWGLAKLIGEKDTPLTDNDAGESLRTKAGTVFGTPGFMAPEQVAGEEVDERADVYALGACLYHVLGGRPPFHGKSESEVFERMRIAAPDALATVVAGVPPDLLTIVEKAMARDRAERYLDAGGLSEDLRRFLNGQLVAAHHYKLSTRITRWLRRHRALVAVVTLAAITSIVVGVWSLRRVLAAQERAEVAAAREAARAEDLLIFKASSYLASDPTLAAATLQQLSPSSPRWADLGTMVAGMRARGVAYGYPSTGVNVRHVEFSPTAGDERVLVAAPGIVRMIDLVARTSTVLAESSEIWGGQWCGGSRVLLNRKSGNNEVVDPKTGAVSPAPYLGSAYSCSDDGIAFVIDSGKLVTHDFRSGRSATIETPFVVGDLWISRTGRWLAIGGKGQLAVLHAENRETYAVAFTREIRSPVVAFNLTETRVAIGASTASDDEVVELELPTLTQRHRWDEPVTGLLGYVGQYLHYLRVDGKIDLLAADGVRTVSTAAGIGPDADLGNRNAILFDPRHISITAGTERYTLVSPVRVDIIAGRPGGRFLVAAGAERVVAWDLAEIVAHDTIVPEGDTVFFVGNRGLIGTLNQPDGAFSLTRYKITDNLGLEKLTRGEVPRTTKLSAYASGLFLAVDESGWAIILEPSRHTVEGIADVASLHQLDDDVLVATKSGVLYRVDRKGRMIGEIGKVGFPITGAAARNGWIFALADDGRSWRRDPRGVVTTTKLANWVSPAVGPDGTVYVAIESNVVAWSPAGAQTVAATFAQPLGRGSILRVNERDVLLRPQGGALTRLDRVTGKLQPITPASRITAVADNGTVVADVNAALVVADSSGRTYPILEQLFLSIEGLAISPDGELVVATENRSGSIIAHVWRIAMRDPKAWVMQATNAIAPATADAAIDWR